MGKFKQGTKGAGALILALALASSCPAVSWAGEAENTGNTMGSGNRMETGQNGQAEASADAAVYGPGSYVIGEDMLPGEYAVFTEEPSEQNAYSTCTITLYKDDTDERRIGTFQFQHHGLITLYKGQHLVITKGYAVEADRANITLGTTGMYKAGRDMEPGTYRITPLTSGSGYYALYHDVRYYYDYIDEYAALFEPVTVHIADGQYLELYDAGSIERVPD